MRRRSLFLSINGRSLQVLAVKPQNIERVEHGLATPTAPQQLVKLRPALVVQDHDLTIEHGLAVEIDMNRRPKLDEAFVDVPLAGNKARFMLVDVRERAKAIHVEFEDVIFAVKSLAPNC